MYGIHSTPFKKIVYPPFGRCSRIKFMYKKLFHRGYSETKPMEYPEKNGSVDKID
jgi:hypothetical protein